MGALSESEIFDCMADSLRKAIDHCEQLAVKPLRGPIYNQFRQELKLVEGCCRQASSWREDTRWLPIGLLMEQCHQKAGEWLRGVVDPATKQRVPVPEGQKHPLFVSLAQNLRGILKGVEDLRTKRAGQMGMILPPMPRAETRTHGRQIQVALPSGMHRASSGLIIPDGAQAQ